MGPFIGGEYVSPGRGCKVSQVHMIARHGERYPTLSMGLQIAAFARNVSLQKGGFSGSLRFLNGWDLESDGWLYAPGDQLEQETLTGPAAGSLTLFHMGEEFRGRYTDIWNFETMGNLSRMGNMKVWASDSERVIHSAKYFSTAFFGVGTNVSVQVIPETRARWGDTLTTTYVLLKCVLMIGLHVRRFHTGSIMSVMDIVLLRVPTIELLSPKSSTE